LIPGLAFASARLRNNFPAHTHSTPPQIKGGILLTPFSRMHDPARHARTAICRAQFIAGIIAGLAATTVFGQTASQRVVAKMFSRLTANDSIRQQLAYSYDLVLTGTFYTKNDSAQVIEEWRIAHDDDSVRTRLLTRRSSGKEEVAKRYEPPVKINSFKPGEKPYEDDPVVALAWGVLNRIKQDRKAQILIDGQVAGKNGSANYLIKFLADGRAGSLWINMQTADLERLEWTYGKSLGVISSGHNSVIEMSEAGGEIRFPAKLKINERSRSLLRRTGSYTEIEIRNFQQEKTP
jgi:hypothetical protein